MRGKWEGRKSRGEEKTMRGRVLDHGVKGQRYNQMRAAWPTGRLERGRGRGKEGGGRGRSCNGKKGPRWYTTPYSGPASEGDVHALRLLCPDLACDPGHRGQPPASSASPEAAHPDGGVRGAFPLPPPPPPISLVMLCFHVALSLFPSILLFTPTHRRKR